MHNSVLFSFEIGLYFSVYIVYIIVGLYKIFALRDQILQISQFQFAEGWTQLARPRDDSNDELENFTGFVHSNWQWYLLHVIVSTVAHIKWPQLQCYGYALVCVLALATTTLSLMSLIIFSFLLVTYYFAAHCHTKKCVWLLTVVWMLIINVLKSSTTWYEYVGYTEYFTLLIIISWSLLRCCSYSLTHINSQSKCQLKEFLGYTLYFPCLVYGPFISYKRFLSSQQEQATEQGNIGNRINTLLRQLLRVSAWWLFMQFALHYFYIHYMGRDVASVALIGSVFWQHAAGYFMGQFFFLYYVVTYGLGIAFAHFDGLNAPRRPRCIGRIHFYSDMWKYFDEGLYEFLFDHIYAELCGRKSSSLMKLFATAITFGFVFFWHGCYTYVLIWSVLNFICLATEKLFKTYVTPQRLNFFGTVGAQRLYALLATQLFIPAAFSNVYFISGQEVGNFLMRGAYLSGLWNYLALCFCSYCFFQCSEIILKKSRNV